MERPRVVVLVDLGGPPCVADPIPKPFDLGQEVGYVGAGVSDEGGVVALLPIPSGHPRHGGLGVIGEQVRVVELAGVDDDARRLLLPRMAEVMRSPGSLSRGRGSLPDVRQPLGRHACPHSSSRSRTTLDLTGPVGPAPEAGGGGGGGGGLHVVLLGWFLLCY